MPGVKKKKKAPLRQKKKPDPIPSDKEDAEEEPVSEEPRTRFKITLPAPRVNNPPSEDEVDELDPDSEPEDNHPYEPLKAYFEELQGSSPPPLDDPTKDDNSNDSSDSTEEVEKDVEEEPAPIVPAKRKNVTKGAKNVEQKQRKKVRREESEEKTDSEEPPVPLIGYTITTISAEEMKKPVARRKAKSCLVELSSQLDWVDVKGRLKIAICDKLFPGVPLVEDGRFEMTWSIPRVVPTPFSLSTAADYEILVKKALKATEPAVRITVEEIEVVAVQVNNQENVPPPMPAAAPAEINDPRPKNKEKSKSRKEADILPANVAINEKIKEIRAEWECSSSRCQSDVCFVPAEGDHLPLGMEHIQKWAAAILAGGATLQTPPNHKLFDAVSTNKITTTSPLLQARLNARNNAQSSTSATVPAPVFNVVLPNNFGMPPYPIPNFPVANAMPVATNTANTAAGKSLIPNGSISGAAMDIPTFCSIYNIPDSIRTCLRDNEITGTHAFSYIGDSDLQQMGFKLGQIIDLKVAINQWAQAAAPTNY